jgi:hypothetical protein
MALEETHDWQAKCEALRRVLQEEKEAPETWRATLKLPPDLEEGFQISISKIEHTLSL